jgi:hypothetical protein
MLGLNKGGGLLEKEKDFVVTCAQHSQRKNENDHHNATITNDRPLTNALQPKRLKHIE